MIQLHPAQPVSCMHPQPYSVQTTNISMHSSNGCCSGCSPSGACVSPAPALRPGGLACCGARLPLAPAAQLGGTTFGTTSGGSLGRAAGRPSRNGKLPKRPGGESPMLHHKPGMNVRVQKVNQLFERELANVAAC